MNKELNWVNEYLGAADGSEQGRDRPSSDPTDKLVEASPATNGEADPGKDNGARSGATEPLNPKRKGLPQGSTLSQSTRNPERTALSD